MTHSWAAASASTPLVLGHRGTRGTVDENSMAAFEQARLQGAHGVELDVRATKSGELLVVHDAMLLRVTNGQDSRQVADLTPEARRQVQLAAGETIPTLEQVVAWAAEHRLLLNVELKTERARNDPVCERVSDLIERYRAVNWVLLSSFHPTLLVRLKQINPRLQLGMLLTGNHSSYAAWADRIGCTALHPEGQLWLRDAALRDQIRTRWVNCWTVNDTTQAIELAKLGVTSLICDQPEEILAALS